MTEIIVFKTELNPTNEQYNLFLQHFGALRFTWNHMLTHKNQQYNDYNKGLTTVKPSYTMQTLKKEWVNQVRPLIITNNWHESLSSRAFRSACDNLALAYKNYFNGNGKPKFKSKGGRESYTLDQGLKLLNSGRCLKLPAIGQVKLKERLKAVDWLLRMGGVIKTITPSKEPTGRIYAAIRLEVPDNLAILFYKGKFTRKTHGFIGVDVGLTDYAALSDGRLVSNPRFLKNRLRKLERLQQEFSKKQVSFKVQRKINPATVKSKSYEKSRLRVANQHTRITFKRKDFTRKLARELVEENILVSVESLSIRNMLKNHSLARSISDAAWGGFFTTLKTMAARYGTVVFEADKWFASSKLCNSCGSKKANLILGERLYDCASCGYRVGRDVGASINLEKEALKNYNLLGGLLDAQRCGESLNGRGPMPNASEHTLTRLHNGLEDVNLLTSFNPGTVLV